MITLLRVISFFVIADFVESAVLDITATEHQYKLSGISTHLALDANGAPTFDKGFADPRFDNPRAGFYWTVWLPGGDRISSKSLEGRSLPFLPAEKDGISIAVETPIGPVLQTQKSFPARKDLPVHHIAIATSASQIAAKTDKINKSRGVINIYILLGLLGLVGWILWKTSVPLRQIAKEINDIARGVRETLSDNYPSDVQGLADKFNDILQNQRDAFAQSTLVLASFNHNIRSGLAKILYQVEGFGHDPDASKSKEISIQIMAIQRQIVTHTNSLRSPDLQYLMLKPPVMDVEQELESVFDAVQRVHRHRELDWYLGVGPRVAIRCDSRSFCNIIFNLLDNAGNWALSRVSCTWALTDGLLTIVIEDDGPGLAASAKTEPAEQGMGIGLQIAHELSAMLGGRVDRANSRLGGAQFCVSIPIPPTDVNG